MEKLRFYCLLLICLSFLPCHLKAQNRADILGPRRFIENEQKMNQLELNADVKVNKSILKQIRRLSKSGFQSCSEEDISVMVYNTWRLTNEKLPSGENRWLVRSAQVEGDNVDAAIGLAVREVRAKMASFFVGQLQEEADAKVRQGDWTKVQVKYVKQVAEGICCRLADDLVHATTLLKVCRSAKDKRAEARITLCFEVGEGTRLALIRLKEEVARQSQVLFEGW